jgi:hypothetical protein
VGGNRESCRGGEFDGSTVHRDGELEESTSRPHAEGVDLGIPHTVRCHVGVRYGNARQRYGHVFEGHEGCHPRDTALAIAIVAHQHSARHLHRLLCVELLLLQDWPQGFPQGRDCRAAIRSTDDGSKHRRPDGECRRRGPHGRGSQHRPCETAGAVPLLGGGRGQLRLLLCRKGGGEVLGSLKLSDAQCKVERTRGQADPLGTGGYDARGVVDRDHRYRHA